jgi:hypothetical protein
VLQGLSTQDHLPPHNKSRHPCLQAVCFAFGAEGLAWCRLGPLEKAGPTWWKVGFLASQLPKALPQPGGDASSSGGGGAGRSLLLVGWSRSSDACGLARLVITTDQ